MDTTTVIKKTFYFPSANGEQPIHAICWLPGYDKKIKAILQISHGMAEHIERYDNFARFITHYGFAVYANDHIGHGLSVNLKSAYGYFGSSNGRKHIVEDMHQLTLIAKKEHPGKPFFLLGHSMGSFLSRKYTTKYGSELTGAIYMGTGNGDPFLKIGILLSRLLTTIKGPTSTGNFLDRLAFGQFNKRIPHPVSQYDWLSVSKENVQNYLSDPLSGFTFTNSAFYELFSLINEVTNKNWAKQIPHNLPILLIAGEEDPVGNYGKGIIQTANLLKNAGVKHITIKLYKNMRHEILNEKNKSDVYEFISHWLFKQLNDQVVSNQTNSH